jgi:hypothetical protein
MDKPVWEGTQSIIDFVHNRECDRKKCQNNMDGQCFAYHEDEIMPSLEAGQFVCEKMNIGEVEICNG